MQRPPCQRFVGELFVTAGVKKQALWCSGSCVRQETEKDARHQCCTVIIPKFVWILLFGLVGLGEFRQFCVQDEMAKTNGRSVVVLVFVIFCVTNHMTSAKEDWLMLACTGDSTCTAKDSNAICFNSKCVCKPTHFYSNSGKNCLSDCGQADLQSGQLLAYPNVVVSGRLTLSTVPDNPTGEECRDACGEAGLCLSASFEQLRSSSDCDLQTKLSFGPAMSVLSYSTDNTGFTHYQKRCA